MPQLVLKLLNHSPAPTPFYIARAVPHMGRGQKMGTDTQEAFFSCSSLIESWTCTYKLSTEPLALDFWIYIHLSRFSYKAMPSPHGQSFSLLFLLALLKSMLLSLYLHPATQCFTVIQLLVCWDHCLLYRQYSLSSLLQPHSYLHLSLLPISSPVCQLFAAGTFHVSVSHLHHQWLLNPKILKVSQNRDSHLRAAVF